ncbi:phosphotransferase system mannose-type iia component [Lucifera butyrica]|uniref:Phosphotransferase system mannose-type iia component n=1 Tax=Lucifera butyrica TaxID=1351585 RepID=A0A498R6S2_9FIRM|nr:PTS sugar transporter subunit IIA [Lucifera butyrica]VBB07194.1 phosphotransferase system mannose-type iia component [Lucifera butyrica]
MGSPKAEILLLTHGGWGEKLIDSLKMIWGSTARVSEIPLMPHYTFEEYFEKVADKVAQMADHSLIITDLFGGTTSNVSAKLSQKYNIHILSGLNAPMLLEAMSSIDSLDDPQTLRQIVTVSQQGCKDVVGEIRASFEKSAIR